jgi:hypothetical protein
MKFLTEFQLFRKKISVVGTAAATKQRELLPNTEIAIADRFKLIRGRSSTPSTRMLNTLFKTYAIMQQE